MQNWIKLSLPHLGGKECEYSARAIESTWIVPLGPFVDEFEARLSHYLNHDGIVALSSGTAAIHLALALLGVGKGDDVICQSMTFAASANPVRYLGAEPVFVDSEIDTWNMDPTLLRQAVVDRFERTGRLPKAIIPVHLYGMPAKMNDILEVACEFQIPVLEDAAEAIGSRYTGKMCGTFGRYGALSFNGNKMITTSGGGALICPNQKAAEKARFLATQARDPKPYYYHTELGYNYRLSNVSAAIGCAQMEVLPEFVERRRYIHNLYSQAFADDPRIAVHDNPGQDFDSNFWLTTVTFRDKKPEEIMDKLAAKQIETRRLWRPMHMQPLYSTSPAYLNGIGESLFNRGLCLPSGSILSDDQIQRVIEALRECL